MKKILALSFAAMMLTAGVASAQPTEIATTTAESPQFCQFSLSSYRGTISNGLTSNFTVGLSCPQTDDVYATVIVFIDGEHTASKVVKIDAGKTQSSPVNILVGTVYNGKSYKLVVQ